MFTLEYAQKLNGKFHGWVEGGRFATREEAVKVAAAHGLTRQGDDHVISESGDDDSDY